MFGFLCFSEYILQIQSMFYKSNPVHVLQYASEERNNFVQDLILDIWQPCWSASRVMYTIIHSKYSPIFDWLNPHP